MLISFTYHKLNNKNYYNNNNSNKTENLEEK